MSKPVIAIDFDGPLAWTGGYERFLHFAQQNNLLVDWDAWHKHHDVNEALPYLSVPQIQDWMQRFHYSKIGQEIQAVPHSLTVLQKHQSKFEYVIVTARREQAALNMRCFLQTTLRHITFAQVYTGYYGRKHEALTQVGATMILEDSLHEARAILASSLPVKVVLFPSFLPTTESIDHAHIHLTHAYRDSLKAVADIDKLMALRSAWHEVDQILSDMS